MSEELSMFYFKAKKLHCGLSVIYSSQQKKNACQGYIWKHLAPWVLLENTGNRGSEPCTHTPGEIFGLSAVLWFQLLLELPCTRDWLWNWVLSSGMAPKFLPLMLESPYNFRLEFAMSIILDRDVPLKQNLCLAILPGWATGVRLNYVFSVTSCLGD